MSFNESNTVEACLHDLLSGPVKHVLSKAEWPVAINVAQQPEATYSPRPCLRATRTGRRGNVHYQV